MQPEKKAYLEGKEIIDFLRKRGAKIAHQKADSDWAAALSSDEGEDMTSAETPATDKVDEVVWISPSVH